MKQYLHRLLAPTQGAWPTVAAYAMQHSHTDAWCVVRDVIVVLGLIVVAVVFWVRRIVKEAA